MTILADAETMKQRSIRILVANHPKLMRDAVLATFTGQPDMEIVGEVSDNAEVEDRVNQTSPDLLITTLDDTGERPAICDSVFKAHPRITIIAVSSRKNHISCYWAALQIKSKNIEPSEESMLLAAREMTSGVLDFGVGIKVCQRTGGPS